YLCTAFPPYQSPTLFPYTTLFRSVAAAAFAVGWILYNVRYTAQDVYATRDPATYTISGRWLVDHASLQIHTRPDVFGSPAGSNVDRKSTRLNSSHQIISYAVFCLK